MLALAVGLGLGYLAYSQAGRQYSADAIVMVVPSVGQATDTTAANFASAYGRVAKNEAVLGPVLAESHGWTLATIRRSVQVSTSPDVPLVDVKASNRSPARAAQLANLVAASLVTFADRDSRQSGIRAIQVASAEPPTSPSSPRLPIDLVLGVVVAGALVGAAQLVLGSLRRSRSLPASTSPIRPQPGIA